jgi:hypothetical protein
MQTCERVPPRWVGLTLGWGLTFFVSQLLCASSVGGLCPPHFVPKWCQARKHVGPHAKAVELERIGMTADRPVEINGCGHSSIVFTLANLAGKPSAVRSRQTPLLPRVGAWSGAQRGDGGIQSQRGMLKFPRDRCCFNVKQKKVLS